MYVLHDVFVCTVTSYTSPKSGNTTSPPPPQDTQTKTRGGGGKFGSGYLFVQTPPPLPSIVTLETKPQVQVQGVVVI